MDAALKAKALRLFVPAMRGVEAVMIEELTSLAREKSSEKRRELLGRVSDLFFDGAENYSDNETFLFGDVLTSLLDDVDVDVQVELSERVATEDRAPRNLAKALASHDNVHVAGPVLQHSTALNEDDILEIARDQSQNHLLAISKRTELGGRVTDVLVERGESQVLESVVSNQGAEFSETGFSRLADKAIADESLKNALSSRADMPVEIAQRVIPVLSDDARSRLLDLMAKDPEKGAQLVHMARDASERQRLLARKRRLEAKVMAEDIKAGRANIGTVASTLADANRVPDLSLVFSVLTEIPANVITNILIKPDGEPIAMLCRSLDIQPDAFRSIAEMRGRRLKAPPSAARQLTLDYMTIDKPNAERAIRFIKMRASMGSGEEAA
ncbi:MAG: DUF2336 domain-containing protein [Pseudomonadota bacterium]